MSQHLTEHDELVSDVVACQLVIKQILDVIDVIAPVEVREKNDYSAESYRLRQPSGLCRSGDPSRGAKSDRID